MKLRVFLLTAMICTLCVGQASALEYTMDAPEDHLFGRPTSDDTIYEWEDPNVDRSKNTALIPPGFGSPTSYLPGSGTALTPNLVPGALEGGGLVSQTGSITYPTVDSGGNWSGPSFTAVTSDLYYSGGYLGTLKIPAIGLSVRVYEGTDSGTLAKGAGHFPGTSIWDGNVCVAGHNRKCRGGPCGRPRAGTSPAPTEHFGRAVPAAANLCRGRRPRRPAPPGHRSAPGGCGHPPLQASSAAR